MNLDRAKAATLSALGNRTEGRTISASKRQIVLALLLLAQLFGSGASVYWAYGRKEIWQIVPLGIIFASVSLLGIWVGLGTSRVYVRLVGALVGILYTSFLYVLLRSHGGVDIPSGAWFHFSLLMSSIAAFTAGPLLILRRISLSLIDVAPPSAHEKRSQFSLRHLLLLMFAVGVMCSIARLSHSATAFPSPGGSHEVREFLFILDHSLGFAATTGIVLWTTLDKGNPMYRCPIAVLAAGANGLLLAYCFDRTSQVSLLAWAAVAASHAIWLALSLLVVRWCGYRLCLKPGI